MVISFNIIQLVTKLAIVQKMIVVHFTIAYLKSLMQLLKSQNKHLFLTLDLNIGTLGKGLDILTDTPSIYNTALFPE